MDPWRLKRKSSMKFQFPFGDDLSANIVNLAPGKDIVVTEGPDCGS